MNRVALFWPPLSAVRRRVTLLHTDSHSFRSALSKAAFSSGLKNQGSSSFPLALSTNTKASRNSRFNFCLSVNPISEVGADDSPSSSPPSSSFVVAACSKVCGPVTLRGVSCLLSCGLWFPECEKVTQVLLMGSTLLLHD